MNYRKILLIIEFFLLVVSCFWFLFFLQCFIFDGVNCQGFSDTHEFICANGFKFNLTKDNFVCTNNKKCETKNLEEILKNVFAFIFFLILIMILIILFLYQDRVFFSSENSEIENSEQINNEEKVSENINLEEKAIEIVEENKDKEILYNHYLLNIQRKNPK